jgi:hypothetical protein
MGYNASFLWHGFVKNYKWIGDLLCWEIGNGRKMKIGTDPYVGGESSYRLSDNLRSILERKGMYMLANIHKNSLFEGIPTSWYTTNDLNQEDSLAQEWNNYTKDLRHAGITFGTHLTD